MSPHFGIDIEKLKESRPDLVVADTRGEWRIAPGLLSRLCPPSGETVGIPLLCIPPATAGLAEVLRSILTIGEAVGEQERAAELVVTYRRRMETVAAKVKDRPGVKVWLEEGVNTGPPLPLGFTVFKGDPLDELLRFAGGVNIFSDRSKDTPILQAARGGDYRFVAQQVIANNPEVILKLGGSLVLKPDGPEWAGVDAVKHGRVHYLGDITLLNMVDRLEQVAGLLDLTVPRPTPTPRPTPVLPPTAPPPILVPPLAPTPPPPTPPLPPFSVVSWRFTPDPGLRGPVGTSPEAIGLPDGSVMLYVNAMGISAYRSTDGLSFQEAAASLPQGKDAAVVSLPDGRWRMYFVRPLPGSTEVGPAEVHSAVSTDGLNWTEEAGVRFPVPNYAVPDAVPLPDGGWRLYWNEGTGTVVSARSADGLNFTRDAGERLSDPTRQFAYGDPAVIRLDNGHWLMAINLIPHAPETRLILRFRIFLARSANGLDWTLDREPLIVKEGGYVANPTFLSVGGGRYRIYYNALDGEPGTQEANKVASGLLDPVFP